MASISYAAKKPAVKRTKSIKLTIFLMRALGLWHVSGKIEKLLSNILLNCTLIMMIFDIAIDSKELYYSRNDFMKAALSVPLVSLVTTELFKMIIFMMNREKVMTLNRFINENFWEKEYNEQETKIFNHYDKVCSRVITVSIVLGQCISWHYILIPAFGLYYSLLVKFNCARFQKFQFTIYVLEKNIDGTRKLPFAMIIQSHLWHETPYYEIVYLIQVLGTVSIFFGTVTFASYVFSISLFTAAQFKMLSQNLTLLCDFDSPSSNQKILKYQEQAYEKLKQCVKTHQMLISLTKEFENLYCYILLGQMFGSVVEICFCGLQILFVKTTLQRQILSFNFLLACSLQLYLFCFSSHEVFIASENVANAVYSMKWFRITNPRVHKHFALSVKIMACRARRPCILSVGKIYPLTLETFASVLGTSLSYFTVLRKIIK